jgi:hypothetical protein
VRNRRWPSIRLELLDRVSPYPPEEYYASENDRYHFAKPVMATHYGQWKERNKKIYGGINPRMCTSCLMEHGTLCELGLHSR